MKLTRVSSLAAIVSMVNAQGWPYQGCYTDSPASRTLRADHFTDATGMTPDACKLFCAHRDFSFAGVEFGRECYCDYLINPVATLAGESDCDIPCSGNPEENCGAADRIGVYYNGNALPAIQEVAGSFNYKGCYTDSVSSRTLPVRIDFPFGIDPDRCTSACESAGYRYAGLEFGRECWCGNTITSATEQADNDCYMRCAGSALQICGAPDRLTLYEDSDF